MILKQEPTRFAKCPVCGIGKLTATKASIAYSYSDQTFTVITCRVCESTFKA